MCAECLRQANARIIANTWEWSSMLKENCAMFSVKMLASLILGLLVFAGGAVAEPQAGLLRAHTAFHVDSHRWSGAKQSRSACENSGWQTALLRAEHRSGDLQRIRQGCRRYGPFGTALRRSSEAVRITLHTYFCEKGPRVESGRLSHHGFYARRRSAAAGPPRLRT